MSTPSTILVVGGTGGTGRLIVAQALARGHEVTALVRSAEKARDLAGAKLVVGDARDEAALREALKGQDAVVNVILPLIAREDVARFVLDQLRDDTWLRRSPLITW